MLLNWSHQCHERDRWWFQSGVPTIPRARVDPRAPRSMVWVSPALTGASPPGRGGCAAAVVGDMCLFIGGADRSPRAFDDLWILRLSPDGTGRWVRKSTTTRGGARLPPRSGASATAVGRKVYVFGGQCPERGTCFNDVVVLDCESWEWSRLPVSGASPPPRNAHVACAAENGRLLVIHGGSSPEEGPMGDVHVLDLEEGAERWTRPKVAGQAPEPREMHAAVRDRSSSSPKPLSELRTTLLIPPHHRWARPRRGPQRRRRPRDLARDAVGAEGQPRRAACAHAAVPWRLRARESDAADENDAALHFGGFDGPRCDRPSSSRRTRETMATLAIGEVDGAPAPRFAHACVSAEGPGAPAGGASARWSPSGVTPRRTSRTSRCIFRTETVAEAWKRARGSSRRRTSTDAFRPERASEGSLRAKDREEYPTFVFFC